MSDNEKELDRQKRRARERELDDFWEIDSLIPARRAPVYPANTETAEVVLEPIEKERARVGSLPASEKLPAREEPVRRFIPPHTEESQKKPQPDASYEPDSSLIRQVRLFSWKNDYRYYEAFLRDANKLLAVHGKECARVPFFSYVPQYSQMNLSQLEWYLWWRENMRAGILLDTDYSYLLLYAYELINLSTVTDPTLTQSLLLKLFCGYRETFHQLDSILPEWICDHGLIHRLPPPDISNPGILAALMSHCNLREYYLPSKKENGYVRALLAFCSNYDYRKSKFYDGGKVLFDRLIPAALTQVSESLGVEGKPFLGADMDDSTMLRDAYSGAICACRVKKKIEVSYCSFSRSHELRYLITDVVKYSENRLRAHLGVRSRLSVYALPVAVREVLDGFFDTHLGRRNAAPRQRVEQTPTYEKLYDLPKTALSFAEAAEIEELSWGTTQKLIEAFEEEGETEAPMMPPTPVPQKVEPDITPAKDDPWKPWRPFLRAVLENDIAGQREAAREKGMLLDVLADRVNELASELFGDILLEENGAAYAVIEDYESTLQDLLAEGKKEE